MYFFDSPNNIGQDPPLYNHGQHSYRIPTGTIFKAKIQKVIRFH